MRRLMFAIVITTASSMAMAGSLDGVWKTAADDDGGWLEVTLGPCEADANKTCGTISKAYTTKGEDPDYENLGKAIVTNMKSHDGKKFSGGTVWDPEKDKTYKSKLKLDGDTLEVDGCIAFICIGQEWTRVK
jgi:uncharacterized protein (DUF2147 family)